MKIRIGHRTNGDILAWLEKQGHQEKPQVYKTEDGEVITYSEDEGYKVVEPKFKVGDWIVSGYNSVAYIESISETKYNLQCKDGSHEKLSVDYINRCWHLWTIQDAKDGDVLSDGTTIFIFKDLLSDGSVMSYCDYDTYSGESDAFCPLSMNLMCSKITPAAKEQRDILFEGMADAGYTFDFEKKELKKIEPKFKVGDWITDGYLHNKITDVLEDRYIVDTKFVKRSAILFNNESRYHLWSIQDAKDGDVLAFKDGTSGILLYKECTENFGVLSHCRIVRNSFIDKEESGWGLTLLSPATKEQRDLLFQKMKEAGYEWDADKKELRKIEQESTELSGKDEEIIDSIISICDREQNNYKTLSSDYYRIEKLKNWLKYLQPQSHWKPSEEQMAALSSAMGDSTSTHYSATLHSLYNDLKKL